MKLGMLTSLLLISAASVVSHKVTPVKKVIDLLTDLDKRLVAEGKAEAAQYDKYACFCKEQADNKIYAIETSEKVMEGLTAKIQELEADIKDLNIKIGDLGTKITALEGDIATKTDARQTEHDTYVTNEKDVADAIDACKRAIEYLKESKGDLAGHTNADSTGVFAQLKKVAALGLSLVAGSTEDAVMTDSHLEVMTHLAKAGQPGDAYDYTYHSNDIIATLDELLKTFKANKNQLDLMEFEAKKLFDSEILDMSNEKKFAEDDKLEKEKIVAYKTEEMEKAKQDLKDETDAKAADESFLKVVKTDCEDKATLFDERSRVRAEELTIISQAMEALKTGVVPNWKANRKLADLQKGKKSGKSRQQVAFESLVGSSEDTVTDSRPKSFLQLRGGHFANKEEALKQKLLALLSGSAKSIGSPVLTLAAMKVKVAEDHFVKVRAMIKDIIEKLEAQAAAEATTKSFCDKAMKAAVTTRDTEQGKIEDYKAQIAQSEADKAKLEEEIAEISAQISALHKALDEATELRMEQKKDNDQRVADAGVGKDAIEFCIELLQDFYDQYEFVQQGANYVPPNADRDGKTVADRAPEIFSGDYKGSQKAGKGILGLLNTMMSDFERTGDVVSGNEADAQSEYDAFKKKTEDDIASNEKLKKGKEDDVKDLEDQLVDQKDSLKTAQSAFQGALDELEKLTSMCVAGEETYEERVEKRKKEIEALKQAHDILENWQ